MICRASKCGSGGRLGVEAGHRNGAHRREQGRGAVEIREFESSRDLPAVRSCLVELQDFERNLDRRLPSGEQSADAYLDWMFRHCREYDGRILVAESDGEVVGVVVVWIRYHSGEPNDIPGEYAYVSDLAVSASHRGRGIGRAFLRAAETLAREAGAERLCVSVKAANTGAKSLYTAEGFAEMEISLEKRLSKKDTATEPA